MNEGICALSGIFGFIHNILLQLVQAGLRLANSFLNFVSERTDGIGSFTKSVFGGLRICIHTKVPCLTGGEVKGFLDQAPLGATL